MPAFTVLDTLELTDAYMNVRYLIVVQNEWRDNERGISRQSK